jgi:hypothetical protein
VDYSEIVWIFLINHDKSKIQIFGWIFFIFESYNWMIFFGYLWYGSFLVNVGCGDPWLILKETQQQTSDRDDTTHFCLNSGFYLIWEKVLRIDNSVYTSWC